VVFLNFYFLDFVIFYFVFLVIFMGKIQK